MRIPLKITVAVALAFGAFLGASPAHAASKPWVIVLCKFSDVTDEPRTPAQFGSLFTAAGAGTDSIYDFYREQSGGLLDIAGTVVQGWYTMPDTKADHLKKSRHDRWYDCVKSAEPDVDFTNFYGAVAIYNDLFDTYGSQYSATLDGVTKTWGAASLDKAGWDPSIVAQEMTHGFGIGDHSWSANPDMEYGDHWDAMSSWTSGWRFTGTYGQTGPGLNAHFRTRLGWIPAPRRYSWTRGCGNAVCPATVTLAALDRRWVNGYLVAEVPTANGRHYTVEFRMQEGWDRAIPRNAVVIHEIRNNVPYQVPVRGKDYIAGESFVDTANDVRVTVSSINPRGGYATILITGDLVVAQPDPLTFPSQPRNTSRTRTLKIANNEASAVTITGVGLPALEFTSSGCGPGTVIAAGQACLMSVKYSPKTIGSHGGLLTISNSGSPVASEVTVEGWSVGPSVLLSAPSLAYAWKPAGSLAKTLVVTNGGADTLSFKSILVGDRSGNPADWWSVWDFEVDPGSTCVAGGALPVAQSCTIVLRFRSSKTGTFSANLLLDTDAVTSVDKVPLAATVSQPAASLTPASLSFGRYPFGTTSPPLSATLTNAGSVPLDVKSVSTGGSFSLVSPSPCPAQLAPGASCTIAVVFSPAGNGLLLGSLVVGTDAPASPQVVSLTGEGPPLLTASPAQVDFGTQTAPVTVTLTNNHKTGDALAITRLSIQGPDAARFEVLPPRSESDCQVRTVLVAPNITCTVDIRYLMPVTGQPIADLVFETNGGPQGIVIVPLTGSPALVATPSNVIFKPVPVGAQSAIEIVTLEANVDVELYQVDVDGVDASDFALAAARGDCSGVKLLAAGDTCSLAVVFGPSGVGLRSARLLVATDAGKLVVDLSGEGI